jgi:hypothetical protein
MHRNAAKTATFNTASITLASTERQIACCGIDLLQVGNIPGNALRLKAAKKSMIGAPGDLFPAGAHVIFN